MPHMRKSEDRGPSVKTAEGAVRLGLYAGGLKLRSLAGMERKGRAYRVARLALTCKTSMKVSWFLPISLFAIRGKEKPKLTSVAT